MMVKGVGQIGLGRKGEENSTQTREFNGMVSEKGKRVLLNCLGNFTKPEKISKLPSLKVDSFAKVSRIGFCESAHITPLRKGSLGRTSNQA